MKENDDRKTYEAPAIVELGSLHGLTLQQVPKSGPICDTARCFHQSSIPRV